MYDAAIFFAWIELAVRWLHIVTAIAWIGSSFYFIALDLGLQPAAKKRKGVHGEEWQVHGGGFYHIQKYLVAPDALPEHLTWFKWESYATWLSGFALMILLYYAGADLYLIDPRVADITVWQAIAVSVGSIIAVWFGYSALCQSRFGSDNRRLMVLLYILLVALAWGYTQVFSGRAALLHLGAITATIMSANVFLVIIPNQKIVVADLRAGRKPDPRFGQIAKQRSTHNNYLTLPVIFLMLSNHYPLAFATEYNWIIASLVFLMGVSIRHYFNTRHARGGSPHWTWGVTGILFLLIMWLSTAGGAVVPSSSGSSDSDSDSARVAPISLNNTQTRYVEAAGFGEVHDIITTRCSVCHAVAPSYDGLPWSPKGIVLETRAQTALYAKEIYLQAGVSNAMPPANYSGMTEEERAVIRAWFRGVPYF